MLIVFFYLYVSQWTSQHVGNSRAFGTTSYNHDLFLSAACLDALKDTIFETAKAMERNQRSEANDSSRPGRPLQRRVKTKNPTQNKGGHADGQPDKRPDHGKVAFSSKINVITSDDEDIINNRPDGELYYKVGIKWKKG